MIRKNALLMASALTALILVLVGGVAASLPGDASAQDAEGAAEAALDGQTLMTIMQQREAAYQEIIDQANQLLAEVPAGSVAPTFPISADTAVAIVLTTVRGGSLQKPPELVDYMGAAAYEVSLVQGLVYVDANTGKILANGAIPVVVVVEEEGSGSAGGGSDYSDDDHEDEDHEDEDHEDEDHEDEDGPEDGD
jgi:uncharacterized membrane protein YkoI